MDNLPTRVRITQNGKIVEDAILLQKGRVEGADEGFMNTGVAVANILAILAKNAPEKCAQDWGEVVLKATVDQNRISIGDESFQIRYVDEMPHRERCLSGKRKDKPNEENYWILNPDNNSSERLVVKCTFDRADLAALFPEIVKYCKETNLPCLKDIEFETK